MKKLMYGISLMSLLIIASVLIAPNFVNAKMAAEFPVVTKCVRNGQTIAYSNDCEEGGGQCVDNSCP